MTATIPRPATVTGAARGPAIVSAGGVKVMMDGGGWITSTGNARITAAAGFERGGAYAHAYCRADETRRPRHARVRGTRADTHDPQSRRRNVPSVPYVVAQQR